MADDTKKTRRSSTSSDDDSASTTSTASSSEATSDETSTDTSGITFTAESADTAHAFADSEMVKNGEWDPATHGEPPDKRPASNF